MKRIINIFKIKGVWEEEEAKLCKFKNQSNSFQNFSMARISRNFFVRVSNITNGFHSFEWYRFRGGTLIF